MCAKFSPQCRAWEKSGSIERDGKRERALNTHHTCWISEKCIFEEDKKHTHTLTRQDKTRQVKFYK